MSSETTTAAETPTAARKLCEALTHLLVESEGTEDYTAETVNALMLSNEYSETDRHDAVLLRTKWKGEGMPIHWTEGLLLHCACHHNAPVDVVQWLLDSSEDTESTNSMIYETDSLGKLPLHLACESSNDASTMIEVIQLLLDVDIDDTQPQTIVTKTPYGKVPIHFACACDAPIEVIQLLLDRDITKTAFLEKERSGNMPIDFAFSRKSWQTIQLLVQASLGERIETKLGLERWKVDVKELINSMTKDDSGRTKVQQIYERLWKYEKMERTSLVELAVWKECCLNGGGGGAIHFDSMRAIIDHHADGFDAAEYKRQRRIKSGADAIIQGVLPFLPDDDDTYSTRRRQLGFS